MNTPIKVKSEPWHLRKEVSIGTLVTLVVLSLGSIGAYYDARGQIGNNTEAVEELQPLPEQVVRMQEQLLMVREQQIELKEALTAASAESREADLMTLATLQEVLIQLARLEQAVEAQE